MKLHKHFLKEDLYDASKEFNCFKDCLVLMNEQVECGDIEKAKQLSIDVTKSLHELSKMAHKKMQTDRSIDLINQLKQRGINIQVIRGFMHD